MNKHETLNMNHETLGNELLSPHFCLREFTESATAREHGINNTPSEEAVENLRALCVHTLEPLREALGLPIVITSGFRTKALNDLLAHASERSQHMAGQAADFYVGEGPVSGSMIQDSSDLKHETGESSLKLETPRQRLIRAFRLIITSEQIDYDQLILYPTFIHVSYVSRERNRRGILLARSDGKLGYGRITRANALKIS